jgi:hypothetical protein
MVEQEWQDALDLEKALKPWCYPFLPPPAGAVPGCRCPLVLQIEAQGCERTQERWFFLLQQSWIISHPASFFFHWRFYTLISGSKWMLWMKLPSFWIKGTFTKSAHSFTVWIASRRWSQGISLFPNYLQNFRYCTHLQSSLEVKEFYVAKFSLWMVSIK